MLPANFTSAGGHFDPGPNGNTDPDANHPYHMGDLPNMEVDANGNGEFSGWFDAAKGQVCYTLGVGSLANPTMAHIHRGDAQTAGPVVVPLANPAQNISETCAPVAPALINEILANPASFYVNVHTTQYPKGAIRAQLKKP